MAKKILYFSVLVFLVYGCGARLKQPFLTESARIGENTTPENVILKNVVPVEPVVVGVYKFRDQTGQYKPVENGTSWSTAVTQGATTILLKSLEDSKWFIPIERENVSNLLNERQIIRSTRTQYSDPNQQVKESDLLPPLLFAGIILEGGIISYDSNIRTGGMGARYFGTGASTQYREDRITVYLRAVSTSNGKILKTIYISKTILSQEISASVFRYVDVQRLLEVEVGMTQNEPKQLAVKEAIDKAVEGLIIEGMIDGLWMPAGGEEQVKKIAAEYRKEVEEAESTKLYNRKFEDQRRRHAISLSGGGASIMGDYSGTDMGYSFYGGYKYQFKNPSLNFSLGAGFMELDRTGPEIDYNVSLDGNLTYVFLPYENISPYIYGGFGSLSNESFNNMELKVQFGAGLEYLPVDNLGLHLFGEQNILFTDAIDGMVQGEQDDYFWRFGLGINFYFGK